jgi:hypothetical protein
VISLLDLGVERPREAMMLRAPETEALYEGSAQKGFGVSSLALDKGPVPLGLKATSEPIEIPRSLLGGGSPSMPQDQNPVDQEAQQSKTKEYQR